MANLSATTQVLLAEDDRPALVEWVKGLEADGFNLGGNLAEELIGPVATELIILKCEGGELHITSSAKIAERALENHFYEACFLDGILDEGDAYGIVERVFRSKEGPIIYLISDALQIQSSILADRLETTAEALLDGSCGIIGSTKDYASNRKVLAKLFGFPFKDPLSKIKKTHVIATKLE